jgi:hypothetical protein
MRWRDAPKTREKGTFLPNLLAGLEQDGCFLCAAVITDGECSLDSLFGDGTLDSEARKDIIAAHGLCNWHAWRGTYILSASRCLCAVYQPLLEELNLVTASLERILGESGEPKSGRAFAGGVINSEKNCLVCERSHALENQYLADLLDFFTDPGLGPRFQNSFGLCLPHLQLAMDRFPHHRNISQLLEKERQKFISLHSELTEFDRKRRSKVPKEPKSPQQASCRKVIELFVGKRGVFPRDGEYGKNQKTD